MGKLHLLSAGGFMAAGVRAGIKASRKMDVGMLVCEGDATAAAAFTLNRVRSAAVVVGEKHVLGGRLRGVVMNSGNANACTGKQGMRDARRMCEVAGGVVGCEAGRFLPSSTGIIGHELPMEKVEAGILEAGKSLGNSREHAEMFEDAILTTDLKRKSAGVSVKIGRETVVVAGVCKGSGMIGPRLAVPHATMLAYVTTDAKVSAGVLRRLLAVATEESFNCVTVDDQASTNDTAVVLASGRGAKVATAKDVLVFGEALRDVCKSLAFQIAADGEGATKVVVVLVDKAKDDRSAQLIARAIANSPLVKCAMNGNDPNWGRIVCAAGMAGAGFDAEKCVLRLEGTPVFAKGTRAKFEAGLVSRSMGSPEVHVHLTCNQGKGSATVWGCDLSKEYVTINADYHT